MEKLAQLIGDMRSPSQWPTVQQIMEAYRRQQRGGGGATDPLAPYYGMGGAMPGYGAPVGPTGPIAGPSPTPPPSPMEEMYGRPEAPAPPPQKRIAGPKFRRPGEDWQAMDAPKKAKPKPTAVAKKPQKAKSKPKATAKAKAKPSKRPMGGKSQALYSGTDKKPTKRPSTGASFKPNLGGMMGGTLTSQVMKPQKAKMEGAQSGVAQSLSKRPPTQATATR